MSSPSRQHQILTHYNLLPQEEMLEVKTSDRRFTIGIPCDDSSLEWRVPLAPLAVEQLTANGFEIIIENEAGRNANFMDCISFQ